jgi:hypothetical protein
VIDVTDVTNSFLYNWSELTFVPSDRFWFGLVTQRTRAYKSDRDIQRGLLVGFSFGRAEIVGHVFNPDETTPTTVIALQFAF